MATDRMRRVDEAVREVLSACTIDLKDPRIGFVTVTDVRTSPDLRHARVYVSVLGTADEHEASLKGLQSAHGYLQSRLARELRLKHTPALTFILDDTAERASRVEQLVAGGSSPGGSEPGDASPGGSEPGDASPGGSTSLGGFSRAAARNTPAENS